MKYTYYFNRYDLGYQDLGGYKINPGDAVLVFVKRNLMTGAESWHIRKDFAETGYPGNMDSSQRRYHGWRGTTNDIYVEAMGVYKVKSVEYADGEYPKELFKVVLNRTDIKKNEE